MKEWYPKIHEILYGANVPLDHAEIRVVFQQEHPQGWGAWVDENVLTIPASSLRNRVDSYDGMIVHEITHLAQQRYESRQHADVPWIAEGIADYIRHKYFEKDIKPALQIDANGRLVGYREGEPFLYALQVDKVDLREKGYERRYTVASTFLYWLEQKKDPRIVPRLHKSFIDKTYTPKLFKQHCGAEVDALWSEFIAQSQRP